jgi:hypothetical protein
MHQKQRQIYKGGTGTKNKIILPSEVVSLHWRANGGATVDPLSTGAKETLQSRKLLLLNEN